MLRLWRFGTLAITALNTGAAPSTRGTRYGSRAGFAHTLEWPVKREFNARDYATVQRIYRYFGYLGFLEPLSVLAAAGLTALARDRRPAFPLALSGTVSLTAALTPWLAFVAPMNAKIRTWNRDAMPADWTRGRDRWETTHAVRFALQLAGLIALLLSVVAETPAEGATPRTEPVGAKGVKMPPPSPTLVPFVREQTVLLTTYRRDGTPVGTPVNIAVDGDRAFVRTWDTAGKWKRMRHNPEVTVGPATWRGTPTGPANRARVRPLSREESAAAGRAIARKHPFLQGILVPLAHRLRGNRTTHVELTPLEDAPVAAPAAKPSAG